MEIQELFKLIKQKAGTQSWRYSEQNGKYYFYIYRGCLHEGHVEISREDIIKWFSKITS
jgi:hypothetical protein